MIVKTYVCLLQPLEQTLNTFLIWENEILKECLNSSKEEQKAEGTKKTEWNGTPKSNYFYNHNKSQ